MSAKAAPGWGSTYLAAIRPGEVALDQAEQLAVHQALARYAFALDQQDLEALRAVLTEDATWAFRIAGESDLGPVVGREAILKFVRDAMGAETDQRRGRVAARRAVPRHGQRLVAVGDADRRRDADRGAP
jgi:hypothetical protein